jgi:hypothetical protein
MTIAQRHLLIAVLALCCSAAVVAADAPKAEPAKDAKAEQKDEKKDGKDAKEAKPEAPTEPDLPSKPYPKNATPKAFQPKGEQTAKADAGHDKAADKPADKSGDKAADKQAAKAGADKPADKSGDKPADKAADKHAGDKHGGDKHAADKPADKAAAKPGADKHGDAHGPAMNKPHNAAKKSRGGDQAKAKVKAATPPDPAMQALAREAAALEAARARDAYVVQARDNLDSVIRKTMPANLFSTDVLRQAFMRANPALMSTANVKLRPGQVLQVPDVATLRAVVMSEGSKGPNGKPDLYTKAPVVAPTMTPVVSDSNPPIAIPRLPVDVASSHRPAPEVSSEEKKKWVRYP